MKKKGLILVNFGGPRDLSEVFPFLCSLLTDKEVIRTPFPRFLHTLIFRNVAKKRAPKVSEDYDLIGGRSPIFFDTESIAEILRRTTGLRVTVFHRYLSATHEDFLRDVENMDAEEILVFPLFPQFSYVTTGSCALWFIRHISSSVVSKLRWIRSYASDPIFVEAFASRIRNFLEEKKLEKAVLVFSAHGLPEKYVFQGDPYQKECEESFRAIASLFTDCSSLLSYQSQFGKQKWIGPSTESLCAEPEKFFRKEVPIVFIPLSFPSDHIETLFEIEELYVKTLIASGFSAYRCPALGLEEGWMEGIRKILGAGSFVDTRMLIRKK